MLEMRRDMPSQCVGKGSVPLAPACQNSRSRKLHRLRQMRVRMPRAYFLPQKVVRMDKKTELRVCDWSLLAMTIAVLISGIQLEVTDGRALPWVWVHIVVCSLFMALIIRHIYLHFKWRNWKTGLFGQRRLTKWMSIFGLLTSVSAIAATVHWVLSDTHTGIGGIHGKIGFVFLILIVVHTTKRIKKLR